jgi:hypothetical protein
MTQTPDAAALQLQDELRQFTGDLQRYRHPLHRRVIYTPGVRCLAERAGAYWLVDAIAGWLDSAKFREAARCDERIAELHFWTLAVDPKTRSAVLAAAADAGEPAFLVQRLEFTDFPLPSVEVWAGFDGEHWTLYLPSEH